MLFSFEEFVLDTARRELRGAAGPIAVEPQVFDLLAYLVGNRDRVVSKDDILAAVWKGRHVSESAFTTRVNAARRAIGDSGAAQRLIRTLPRRGLRFVGDVGVQPEAEARPDRPSIAVLPFANLSGDPEQDWFADGVVEEITTALSRQRRLSVIARNSSFAWKGRAVDVKQVGRALGARYLLEGSIRRAGRRLRIASRLVDAETGTHLWADRFDGALEDVFDLQDRVTASVVGAIAPHLGRAEIERARRKPTESLDAYDYYLRGMAHLHRWTREDSDAALENFRRAIELDLEFAPAYGLAGRCYSQRKACGWVRDRRAETAEAERLARLAAELGRDDAVALCTAGIVLAYVAGNLDDGAALVDRALALDPNLAWAWVFGSWVAIWRGESEVASHRAERALKLSPSDPEVLFFIRTATAYCHFLSGRHPEALASAQAAMRQRPDVVISLGVAAASGALAGHIDVARDALARLRRLEPSLGASDVPVLFPFGRPDDLTRWREGLRLAGWVTSAA
jgi:TolB-like protein/tetratricopeptide (TPR) repeat protein